MAVQRKAGFGFGNAPGAVVSRGQFEVDLFKLQIRRLVLDAHIRQRNLSVHHNESMSLGKAFDLLRIFLLFSQLRAVAIQIAFQFVIEQNAKGFAVGAFDTGGLCVKEAVEFGVVLGFARFHDAVIEPLLFRNTARVLHQALPCFC